MAGTGLKDIMWFDTDGSEMWAEKWNSGARCVGMLLSGDTLDVRDTRGEPVRDDTYLVLFNAHHEPVKFALPGKQAVNWEVTLDTRLESGFPEQPEARPAGEELEVMERSMCVLRLVKGSQEEARSISWRQQQKAEAVAPPVAAAALEARTDRSHDRRPPLPRAHREVTGGFGSRPRHSRARRTTAQVSLHRGMKTDFLPQGAEVSAAGVHYRVWAPEGLVDNGRDSGTRRTNIARSFSRAVQPSIFSRPRSGRCRG